MYQNPLKNTVTLGFPPTVLTSPSPKADSAWTRRPASALQHDGLKRGARANVGRLGIHGPQVLVSS